MAGAAAAQPTMEGEPPEEPSPEREEAEAEEESIVKPAAALPDRPVMLRVGGSLSWDSNIFRAPQARSERIRVGYAGLVLPSYRGAAWFS
jgi:hypothetical protein